MPYPEDLAARAAIVDLLGSVWHHVPSAIERAHRWGGDWFELSTPFVRAEGARAVSVVGVIEMPLRVAGADVIAAGIHGVCTRPAHRGHGHFRAAMEEALRFADSFASVALLWTEQPAIYERFGFRRVVEEIVRVELDPPSARGERPRRLDPERDDDLALLRRALDARAPISERLATRDRG
ncbi:MAG: GNAT family N-acetyltransferase, partial [Myxococcota bacterium]|nr:GNAT family N-acetyltransferase [Myxococcota bacterium]